MIDRYLLRYFLAVIDQGNFTKAAAHCHVSQPTLSTGIAKLEALLERPLFIRTNRRVELTQAATQLVRHARQIEAEFIAAEREVQGASAPTILRLGVLSSLPTAWIEEHAAGLRKYAGNARVEYVDGRERDLQERLSRGRIDVALTILRRDGEKLFSEGYSLAMAADHPLAGRDPIDGAELADNVMILRRHCELLSETSRYFTARGVRPFFAARTTSDDHALRLVRAGLGVTVMPDCFRAREVARVRLIDFPFVRDIGLLFAPHANSAPLRDGPALRSLTEIVERQSAEL